ncbi:Y-family DNA polymerase [Jutongia huaianensis]|uniref:UmuC domain-containing protein n=1 Tax=Jutongia huaianensis TaxID=2763668 RepID=A0ABR7N227_9FIRM|nr:hypothetical protein [Jutongia huaianensis]
MLHRPQMRNVPMAVGGDPQARHGIVLTANYLAKWQGVKTGMALWQARQVYFLSLGRSDDVFVLDTIIADTSFDRQELFIKVDILPG